MKKPLALSLLALVLVSAGCNSTNRLGIAAGPKSNGDLVVAGPQVGTDAATDATSADAAAAADALATDAAAVPGKPGVKPGAGGTGGGAGTGGGSGVALSKSPSAGFVAPGVTATEIKIGITLVQAGTVFGDITGVPIDFGDTKAQANAAVEHVNKNGGIAGRKVKPVYYNFDLGRPGLGDGASEDEACAKWTQDDRVFAGINTVLARQALLVCLAKSGVPAIHQGMPMDEEGLKKYRDFWYASYGGAALTLDRLAEKQVKVFAAQGLFAPKPGKPDSVVGIEYFDDPAYKRVVDETFRPLLAKAGVKKVFAQPAPRGGVDAASYIPTFVREGVTDVLFLGEGGAYPLFFMRAAEDQQYFPDYGLHSDMALGQLLQPGAPPRQLANSKAMGWTPVVDVDDAHDPGPVSARNALCLDIQKRAGQDMGNRAARVTALGYCESLWLLQDALAPVREITVAGLSAGVAALGSSFVSSGVFGSKFSATRHDGAEAYRDLFFDTSTAPGSTAPCNCFRYTGATRAFPG